MRIRAEAHVEGEPYADMLPPLDLTHGVPAVGDEVVIAEARYTCTRRSFGYDVSGRLKDVTVSLQPA
ncbi:MAG TPA: hypothetical protein VGN14_03810 [Candidatus Elarobacter sp.]|jgi:hypothetical protein